MENVYAILQQFNCKKTTHQILSELPAFYGIYYICSGHTICALEQWLRRLLAPWANNMKTQTAGPANHRRRSDWNSGGTHGERHPATNSGGCFSLVAPSVIYAHGFMAQLWWFQISVITH